MRVYKRTREVNQKVYVGRTKYDVKSRRNDHVCWASRCSAYTLHRAIRKRRANSFTVEVVAITHLTLADAKQTTGVTSSSISLCCNGKRIRTAGGLIWRFA